MAGMSANAIITWSRVFAMQKRRRRIFARIRTPDGGPLELTGSDIYHIEADSNDYGWSLDVKQANSARMLTGESALHAISAIMPRYNVEGGTRKEVASAVRQIESVGDPSQFVKWVAGDPQHQRPTWRRHLPIGLHNLSTETRLAMEMAVNEESERRAMQGELTLLEHAWKDAEDIAAIADGLALPGRVEADLSRLRRDSEKL